VYFSSESGYAIQGTAIILERPLLAESGPCKLEFRCGKSVRFGEKRTFRNIPKIFTKLTNLERPLSTQKRPLG
jgi:hypothetical protein